MRAQSMLFCRAKNLELLFRNGAELTNPDSILTVLASHEKWGSGYKKNLLQAYKAYAKWKKISLQDIELPKFRTRHNAPFVPKESQLDQLIAGSGWKTGAFLQLLKETGARTKEAASLQWSDIDTTNHKVTARNPAKNGLPRQIHVSEKCIEMIKRQPHNGDYVFGKDPENIRKRMRKKNKKTGSSPTQNHCKSGSNTKSILIQFRVTPQQWKKLLQKAGGKGKVSNYIRRKLGFKD